MSPGEQRRVGWLRLVVDRNLVVTGAEGDRGLVTADGGLVGRGALELVHPVDRQDVKAWLREGPGCSPAFRGAEVEEPPRWFRFLAVRGEASGERDLLLEDVTEAIREESLRHRLMEVLARFRGPELLERIPALALELVGGTCGCFVDLHGPLAVVRAVAGLMGIGPGSALTVEGSPLADLSTRDLAVFERGLRDRFPRSAVVKAASADSGIVIPVVADGEDVVAAILVLLRGARRFAEWERTLLRTLASRAAVELQETGGSGSGAGRADGAGMAAATRLLGAQGAVNAFGNLLAAIGLNSELALGETGLSPVLRARLDRISDAVLRGRKLVRFVDLMSAPMRETPSVVSLERIIRELADILPLCAEGLDLATERISGGPPVWAAEGTLLVVLATLLLAAADSIPRGVRATIVRSEVVPSPAGTMVPVLIRIMPRVPEMPGDAWARLSETVAAVEPAVLAMGGVFSLDLETNTFQVELQLLSAEGWGVAGEWNSR